MNLFKIDSWSQETEMLFDSEIPEIKTQKQKS